MMNYTITDNCEHDKFSDSPIACSKHGEDADCWEMVCDNCNEVQLHELAGEG